MPYYDLGSLEDISTEPGVSVKPEEEKVWAATYDKRMSKTFSDALDSDFSFLAAHILYIDHGEESIYDLLNKTVLCARGSFNNTLILSIVFRGIEYRSKKSTQRIFIRRLK